MSRESVLIVDDEPTIRESLADILSDEGYQVLAAPDGQEALRLVRAQPPDLVLLDIWLPGMDGLQCLQALRKEAPWVPVVMITGHGSVELAVKSIKLGAYDFLEKPLSMERVLLTVQRALQYSRLQQENRALREGLQQRPVLIGSSEAMQRLRQEIHLAAQSSAKVLIRGESGSGKELVARLLHELSQRRQGPFVALNCAAIPQELIESELFGHEKGAFTGASEAKQGRLELAHRGTLFLDEVGDMSLPTQAKLLRVLETQSFQRVGGTRTIQVDVRVLAATNKDLRREIQEGRFREDLYWRLNVIPIEVPPLRQHREDIPELSEHFLSQIALEHGRAPKRLSPQALRALMAHHWPGNVRELRNTLERLVIMSPSEEITAQDVSFLKEAPSGDLFGYQGLKEAREAFERQFILRKLTEHGWNISRTAEALGIERSNLHRKLKGYGIVPPKQS
jgi:two-component system nitrogen regulation response regulator NtrX